MPNGVEPKKNESVLVTDNSWQDSVEQLEIWRILIWILESANRDPAESYVRFFIFFYGILWAEF